MGRTPDLAVLQPSRGEGMGGMQPDLRGRFRIVQAEAAPQCSRRRGREVLGPLGDADQAQLSAGENGDRQM